MNKSIIAVLSVIALVAVATVQSHPLSEETLKTDQTIDKINAEETFGVNSVASDDEAQNRSRVKRCICFPILRRLLGLPPCGQTVNNHYNYNIGNGRHNDNRISFSRGENYY
ncbi:uncharacterized protein [Maniola hyperantus]|uniref:uncharacterized protein isoform X2 n=1 Tax=Aphantopus hyperantus TaxID=2795564 RepID=UPI002134B0FB